jgi:hypothetical protein
LALSFPFVTDVTYHADWVLTYSFVDNPDPIQVMLLKPYWLVWSLSLYFEIATMAAFGFAKLRARMHHRPAAAIRT